MSNDAEMPAMTIARDPLWGTPPEFVEARRDEVHVWRVSLDVAPSCLQSLSLILSADERDRAERFRFQRDRQHFIASRAFLRILIGRYLQRESSQVKFGYGPNGKPFLADNEEALLRFNLSHSGGIALYAITRGREIGIDVEYIGKDVDAEVIAGRFFSPQEVAALKSLPKQQRQRAFFTCWTRKEAYLKGRGDGLSVALDSFSVSLSPDEPAALLDVQGVPEEASQWSLVELNPGPSHVAALAVADHDWLLRGWQLADHMLDLNRANQHLSC